MGTWPSHPMYKGHPPYMTKHANVTSNGRVVAIGTQRAHEVELIPVTDTPPAIIRWAGSPRELTSRDIGTHKATSLAARPPAQQASLRRNLEKADARYATHAPALQDLRLDDDGRLWVEHPVIMGSPPRPGRWTIFDSTGRMLGGLELPERANLLGVERDLVLLRILDGENVEFVRVHRLVRAGPTAAATP